MRVKIPRWEIAVICSALLFPDTSLSAQEVGQEEKEVKEMRQDVEQLQQDVRQLREEVRRLQEEIHGFRHMAIFKGTWSEDEPILVRVHSSCATGDILGSQR